jgi:transposase
MVGRPRIVTTAEDSSELEALALSARRDEADRARAILLSATGWTSGQIARAFGVTPDSVRRWRTWFMAEGVDGLRANPQTGAAPVKSEAALALAREVLSAPVTDRPNWTLPRLQTELAGRSGVTISKSQLSKALKTYGPPLCKRFLRSDLSSLHQRIRSRGQPWPRWRSARPEPHKGAGIECHFSA